MNRFWKWYQSVIILRDDYRLVLYCFFILNGFVLNHRSCSKILATILSCIDGLTRVRSNFGRISRDLRPVRKDDPIRNDDDGYDRKRGRPSPRHNAIEGRCTLQQPHSCSCVTTSLAACVSSNFDRQYLFSRVQ